MERRRGDCGCIVDGEEFEDVAVLTRYSGSHLEPLSDVSSGSQLLEGSVKD